MSIQISFDSPNGPDHPVQKREHLPRGGSLLLIAMLAFGTQVILDLGNADVAQASGTRMGATYETALASPGMDVSSSLDMRDDNYNGDYIFGMTKGVSNSTIIPAIKPLFFLITIPLDLVFLPFAAIGGFF